MDTGDLDRLVQLVFGQDPRPPHSIQLEIDNAKDPTTGRVPTSSDSHDIFRTLGQLLTHGVLFLYGEETSHVDVEKLQQYLASVGWKAIMNPSSPENHPQALPYVLAIPMHDHFVRVAFEPYSL